MIDIRFANDIELMTGSRPGIYWMICWKYISPLTMIIIVIASFTKIIVEGSGYLAVCFIYTFYYSN